MPCDQDACNTKAEQEQLAEYDVELVKLLVRLEHEIFMHCLRTHDLAQAIGSALGLSSPELFRLKMGALLHDVGKHDAPGPEHPRRGWEYVSSIPGLSMGIKNIVLHHHRWADGTGGYPQDPEEERPCFLTQIVSVADTIDRCLVRQVSLEDCLAFLDSGSGTQFNQYIVKAVKNISTELAELMTSYAEYQTQAAIGHNIPSRGR